MSKPQVQKTRYMANPDVLCRQEPDRVVLFNPDTGNTRATNDMGYLIWRALARPLTPGEVAAHVIETCEDAPVEQVGDDVSEFLQALLPSGFIGEVLPDADSRFYDAGPVVNPPSPAEPALDHTPDGEDLLRSTDPDQDRFYRGDSMLGTFRPGDRLIVEPVAMAAVRVGDVVVYSGREELGEPDEIVHRVVTIAPDGLVTRGDNNPWIDARRVIRDILLGRVTHLERNGRVHPVWGGRWGSLRARALGGRKRVWWLGRQTLRKMVGRPYRRLRESGWARRLWRPAVTRVLVTTDGGPVVKHVSGRRIVAWWWPETDRFRCRKPYDLVIPRPGRESS